MVIGQPVLLTLPLGGAWWTMLILTLPPPIIKNATTRPAPYHKLHSAASANKYSNYE